MAKGVASTIAGACLVPQSHSAQPSVALEHADAALVDMLPVSQQGFKSTGSDSFLVPAGEAAAEWTSAMEKEFRKLALEELKGTITPKEVARLEELTTMRNRLQDPLTAEEMLMQIRRDRVLEKMADALDQYVKFHQSANQKRPTAK